jgi:peroxiredoxin
MPKGLKTLIAVMLVMLSAWAGIRFYLLLAARGSGAPRGMPTAAGQASIPNPSDSAVEGGPLPGAKIPERLPAFSLNDLDGKATPISTWKGRSLIINFWATWCAPCQREIPLLKTLSREWAAQDFTVVGVAVDHRDKVRQFSGKYQIPYPILVGEQEGLDVASQLGMSEPAFPFTVFTDARGQIVTLFVGELHKSQVDLILATVQNLNRGQMQLAQARQAIVDGLATLAAQRS